MSNASWETADEVVGLAYDMARKIVDGSAPFRATQEHDNIVAAVLTVALVIAEENAERFFTNNPDGDAE